MLIVHYSHFFASLYFSFFATKLAFSDSNFSSPPQSSYLTPKMSVHEKLEHRLNQLKTKNIIKRNVDLTFLKVSNVKIGAMIKTLHSYLENNSDEDFKTRVVMFLDQINQAPADENTFFYFEYSPDFIDQKELKQSNSRSTFTFKYFFVAVQKKLWPTEMKEQNAGNEEDKSSEVIVSYSIASEVIDYYHQKKEEEKVVDSFWKMLFIPRYLLPLLTTVSLFVSGGLYLLKRIFPKSANFVEEEETSNDEPTIDQQQDQQSLEPKIAAAVTVDAADADFASSQPVNKLPVATVANTDVDDQEFASSSNETTSFDHSDNNSTSVYQR